MLGDPPIEIVTMAGVIAAVGAAQNISPKCHRAMLRQVARGVERLGRLARLSTLLETNGSSGG
jgi:hypothetical protein